MADAVRPVVGRQHPVAGHREAGGGLAFTLAATANGTKIQLYDCNNTGA